MNPGTIFSICAGILIGMKLYYWYYAKKLKKEEKIFSESRGKMEEIIDQEQYRILRPRKGERIVDLGNGRYLVVTDRSSSRFWHDLWYGSGWKNGKDG